MANKYQYNSHNRSDTEQQNMMRSSGAPNNNHVENSCNIQEHQKSNENEC
jgi:hypothetical protein